MAAQVRVNIQFRLDQREYVQVERTSMGTLSMSFTADGSGVTFLNAQYEPITQQVRDVTTGVVKQTVVLNAAPYQLVGVAMLYDAQDCRWKIDSIEYPGSGLAP